MATNESKNAEATRKSAEVKEWELDYSLKKQPVIAVGRRGKFSMGPKGLALYESNQLIYIADRNNRRIQVVTFEGNFVTCFGRDILSQPWGIAVTEDQVFVTDYNLGTLFQFSDLKLARTGTRGSGEGELLFPQGLCTDYNGDVYVADCTNNRVCIFSEDLKFLNCWGNHQLQFPADVKVTPHSIVVLDNSPNSIHFYSRSGHLINSCVSQKQYGRTNSCDFFCFDPAGNILLTYYSWYNIKIFSPSGQLIHKIEGNTDGNGKGPIAFPTGIRVSQSGTLFLTSSIHGLQMF